MRIEKGRRREEGGWRREEEQEDKLHVLMNATFFVNYTHPLLPIDPSNNTLNYMSS